MYEAHKWKIGEEITSEKLNHIEKGIEEAGLPREITDPQDGQTLKYDAASGKWVNGEGGSGKLVVNATSEVNTTTLDKTWQEIYDAFPNAVVHSSVIEDDYVTGINQLSIKPNGYLVNMADGTYYSSATPNDYPSYTVSGGGGGVS